MSMADVGLRGAEMVRCLVPFGSAIAEVLPAAALTSAQVLERLVLPGREER